MAKSVYGQIGLWHACRVPLSALSESTSFSINSKLSASARFHGCTPERAGSVRRRTRRGGAMGAMGMKRCWRTQPREATQSQHCRSGLAGTVSRRAGGRTAMPACVSAAASPPWSSGSIECAAPPTPLAAARARGSAPPRSCARAVRAPRRESASAAGAARKPGCSFGMAARRGRASAVLALAAGGEGFGAALRAGAERTWASARSAFGPAGPQHSAVRSRLVESAPGRYECHDDVPR